MQPLYLSLLTLIGLSLVESAGIRGYPGRSDTSARIVATRIDRPDGEVNALIDECATICERLFGPAIGAPSSTINSLLFRLHQIEAHQGFREELRRRHALGELDPTLAKFEQLESQFVSQGLNFEGLNLTGSILRTNQLQSRAASLGERSKISRIQTALADYPNIQQLLLFNLASNLEHYNDLWAAFAAEIRDSVAQASSEDTSTVETLSGLIGDLPQLVENEWLASEERERLMGSLVPHFADAAVQFMMLSNFRFPLNWHITGSEEYFRFFEAEYNRLIGAPCERFYLLMKDLLRKFNLFMLTLNGQCNFGDSKSLKQIERASMCLIFTPKLRIVHPAFEKFMATTGLNEPPLKRPRTF